MLVYATYFFMSYYDHVEFLLMVKFNSVIFACILLMYMPCVSAFHLSKFMEARSLLQGLQLM